MFAYLIFYIPCRSSKTTQANKSRQLIVENFGVLCINYLHVLVFLGRAEEGGR